MNDMNEVNIALANPWTATSHRIIREKEYSVLASWVVMVR